MAGSPVTHLTEKAATVRKNLLQGRIVVAIVGPTASGKTTLSLELARLLGGEIVSADSRQVYRHLDIGTAKAPLSERGDIPHYFIDLLEPDQIYSAGLYGEQARAVIQEIFLRGNPPVVVGGSGLYVRSLLDGLFEGPGADPDFRSMMELRVRHGGLIELVEELRRVDPTAAARIDPTKPRRVIRALEVHHATGRTLTDAQDQLKPGIPFQARRFGLQWDRRTLYGRIDARVDWMIESGLVKEVENLQRMGFHRGLNALNTVGYAETFAMLEGEIDENEMIRLIKRNSRRYAKRQVTWFNADDRITWLIASADSLITSLMDELEKNPGFASPAHRSR